MQVTLRGKRWEFTRPRMADWGQCEPVDRLAKRIRVHRDLTGIDELDTILHELLHAVLWDLSEETVEECGTDIARVLWKLGYRRESNGKA